MSGEGIEVLNRPACPICGSRTWLNLHQLSQFEIWQCSACSLQMKNPLPSRDELLEWYDNPAYAKRPYFRSNVRSPSSTYCHGLRLLKDQHPTRGRMLEIGCGAGAFLEEARSDGWHAEGIECSSYLARRARDRGFDVRHALIEEVSLLSRTYAAIVLWDVIEHLRAPQDVVPRLAHALAPGGTLLIFTPNEHSLVRSVAPFLDRIVRPGDPSESFLESVYSKLHTFYFNPVTLTKLLSASDLVVARYEGKPMRPGRARNLTPLKRTVLRAIDCLGAIIGRRYRTLMIANRNSDSGLGAVDVEHA